MGENCMSKFKQIAILVGQADEYNQSRFLKGFLTKGFEYDFNVCIFSMYRKYQDNSVREKGESNIFKLVDYPSYDAIVLLKDTIQTADVAKKLEEDIHACYDGPVVVIEQESEYFQSISSDSYDSMYELVSHMIEEHGYRDIAFLAGKKNHIHSIIRLEAYCACLKDHGIAVDKNRIEYGDFWYRSGEQYADRLMLDPDHLPEAVVCANDCMAIGLCRTLTRHGVKIPEDIAVAGYDSNQEGKTSPLILTSMETPAYECGVYTSDYLHGQFSGTTIEAFHKTGTLIAGESCGCRLAATDNRISRRKSWSTETSRDGFMSINNTMYEDLMLQSNLRDYLSTVYSYAYQLRGIESFHLFLNESYVFLDENPVIHCANDGYSEKMIYAIRYNRNGMNSMISTENRIERKNILPELSESAPGPAAYFFTPVFFENECFGYSIISYGSVPTSYDEIYRLWIKCVARGFESLKRNIRINQLEQNEKFTQSKFGNYRQSDIDKLSEEERKELHLVEHILDDNMLTYHFQPIVNTRDGEIYSYEALMRATTEEKISPLVIIKF